MRAFVIAMTSYTHAGRKSGAWFVLFMLTVLAVVLVFPSKAFAHNDVNNYFPDTGEISNFTPDTISLEFSGKVSYETLKVSLLRSDGTTIPLTGKGFSIVGKTVNLLYPSLDTGTYVIVWQDAGPDGHLAVGQSHFSVGEEDGMAIGDYRPKENIISVSLDSATRIALYTVIALLLGWGWLLLARAGTINETVLRGTYKILPLLILTRLLLVSYRGSSGSIFYGITRAVTDMRALPFWLLLISVGLVTYFFLAKLAKISQANPDALVGNKKWAGALVGLAVFTAVGLVGTGHMAMSVDRVLLVPLTALHIVGMSLWLGAMAVYFVASKQDVRTLGRFASSFSIYGILSFLLIGISGVLMVRIRAGESMGSLLYFTDYNYGRLLAFKWFLLLLIVLPIAGWHLYRGLEFKLGVGRKTELGTPGGTFKLEIGALVAIVLAGSFLGGISPIKPSTVYTTKNILTDNVSYETCTSGQTEGDKLICVSNYFSNKATNEGMPAALKEVTLRNQDKDPWLSSYCHVIGHKLGRLGYKIYDGNLAQAFDAGTDPCDYGYLHGVIEGASSGFTDLELRNSMTTLCSPVMDAFGRDDHMYKQCIHGMGHAAARRVNNDLVRGIEFCKEYPVDTKDSMSVYIFTLCVTGVSMEWNSQTKANDARTLPVGHKDTLLGQCLLLEDLYKIGCIEYGTSSMGGILEKEIEARNWCDVNLDDPLPCYHSIGRDVIWSPTISKEQAIEVCTGGKQGKYAEGCIERALGSVATIALDAEAIDDFCPLLDEKYRHLCAKVKKSMVKQIEETLRGT